MLSNIGSKLNNAASTLTSKCSNVTLTICEPNPFQKGLHIFFCLVYIILMITSLELITKGKSWKTWISIMVVCQFLFLLQSMIYIYVSKKVLNTSSFMAVLLGMVAAFISIFIAIMYIKTNSYPNVKPYFYMSIGMSFLLFVI